MMVTPYFSVIIPAYQAEKTLRRCLDSIVNQSFTDFEVIVINDGSTDQTYNICKEYETDGKIRVVSQANKGISPTRQLGLNLSRGKYIQFIDSDDWIDTSYLDDMHNLLVSDEIDIVITDYFEETVNNSIYKSLGIKSLAKDELIKGLVTKIPGVLWNKVIKRELLTRHNIGFTSGLSYCEDWVVTYELFNVTSKIFYYDKAFYHYDLYSNTNSLARTIDRKALERRYDYLTYIRQLGVNDHYPEVYETQCAAYAYIAVRSGLYSSSLYKREFMDLNISDTYLPFYKKVVLYIARIFNVHIAYWFDRLVRKLIK